jgi:anti-sigma regulatory factor (Ser/Thr protein kinase)
MTPPAAGFRHDALMYSGRDEFVSGCSSFIRDGLAGDEPTLVVVSAEKIGLLREALGPEADRVTFADMDDVGANPARIIPAWREFVNANPGRPIRGIGEPISSERSSAELAECHRHESLLNVAFDGAEGFWLLCPYDTGSLDAEVVEEAHRTHPRTVAAGHESLSDAYAGLELIVAPFADPLPEPPVAAAELAFDVDNLPSVRALVADGAAEHGIVGERGEDLLLAANEIATNSIRHGGGEGVLRIWTEGDTLICDVRDAGGINDPLAGRERPGDDQTGGFGLWLANQACDLVQVRAFADGGAVRLHMRVR